MTNPTPITPEEIAELKRLCDEATPGPWQWYQQPGDTKEECIKWAISAVEETVSSGNFKPPMNGVGAGDLQSTTEHWLIPAVTGCGPTSDKNAIFIAAARSALPRLIERVEFLESENKNLKSSQGAPYPPRTNNHYSTEV